MECTKDDYVLYKPPNNTNDKFVSNESYGWYILYLICSIFDDDKQLKVNHGPIQIK